MLEQVRSERRFTWGDVYELMKRTPWFKLRYCLASSERMWHGVWWVEGVGLVVGAVRKLKIADALKLEPTERVKLVYGPRLGNFYELQIESRNEEFAKSLIPTDADDE
jgi:hypothetical protein